MTKLSGHKNTRENPEQLGLENKLCLQCRIAKIFDQWPATKWSVARQLNTNTRINIWHTSARHEFLCAHANLLCRFFNIPTRCNAAFQFDATQRCDTIMCNVAMHQLFKKYSRHKLARIAPQFHIASSGDARERLESSVSNDSTISHKAGTSD